MIPTKGAMRGGGEAEERADMVGIERQAEEGGDTKESGRYTAGGMWGLKWMRPYDGREEGKSRGKAKGEEEGRSDVSSV